MIDLDDIITRKMQDSSDSINEHDVNHYYTKTDSSIEYDVDYYYTKIM